MLVKKNKHNNQLAKRISIYVVLVSSFIAIFSALFQLYTDYRVDIDDINARLVEIEKSHLSNIASRVWVLNIEELDNTLQGILNLPSVMYLEVKEGDEQLLAVGKKDTENVIDKTYPLYYQFGGVKQQIGSLYVVVSLQETYQRIIDRAFNIVLSNMVKTFIVSGLILIIFFQLVGKHLITLSRFAEELDINALDNTLELKRKISAPEKIDEIDLLANAMTALQSRLKNSIDDLKNNQATLARSEAKFRGVLESAADGVILTDENGNINLVNPSICEMMGYTESELIGKPMELLVPSRFTAHKYYRENYYSAPAQRIMGAGITLYARRKNGDEIPVEISLTPVETDQGLIVAAMVQNVEGRKQAEQEKEFLLQSLASKNAELERFTYTASHDLKSPLVTISGFIGLLKKDIAAGENERVVTDLNQISDAVKTMQQLLDDLLQLSRVGRMPAPLVAVSLNTLVSKVLAMLAGKIKQTRAIINVDEDLPIVKVEELRIKEVYLNLIENALKYTNKGVIPEIEIGMKHTDSDRKEITLFVKDNGIGIDSRYHEKVFDLFERLNIGYEGTGIGLAIVKRVIDVHGGHIWIESAGINGGSTFWFTIKT